jgi:hypothetical protein
MKKLLFLTFFLFHHYSVAQTPTQIGGFTLNSDVEQYKGYLKAETTLPIRFMESLQEVEIQPQPGFKSGYIAYGSCAVPGKVVRIKLKYKDSSKDFYKELLEAFKDKFGKAKWLGDPFRVVSVWRWSFKDEGGQVDIYLQHNLSDKEEKLGTSVKMTMVNLVNDEIDCFNQKNPDFRRKNTKSVAGDKVDITDLLPK